MLPAASEAMFVLVPSAESRCRLLLMYTVLLRPNPMNCER